MIGKTRKKKIMMCGFQGFRTFLIGLLKTPNSCMKTPLKGETPPFCSAETYTWETFESQRQTPPYSAGAYRAEARAAAVVVSGQQASAWHRQTITRKRERAAEHAYHTNTERQDCPLYITHSWRCATGRARSVSRPKHVQDPNCSTRPWAYHWYSALVLQFTCGPVCAGKLRARGCGWSFYLY